MHCQQFYYRNAREERMQGLLTDLFIKINRANKYFSDLFQHNSKNSIMMEIILVILNTIFERF